MQQYLKAIYATVSSALVGVGAAYVQGNGHIGLVAALTIANTSLAAGFAVWGVPNAQKKEPVVE